MCEWKSAERCGGGGLKTKEWVRMAREERGSKEVGEEEEFFLFCSCKEKNV